MQHAANTRLQFWRLEAVQPHLLKISEVAIRLGIGRSKVYAMLSAGELKARKLGRAVRVSEAEVDRLIASLPQAEYGSTLEAA
jgi:excisionase family DNA binding protein